MASSVFASLTINTTKLAAFGYLQLSKPQGYLAKLIADESLLLLSQLRPHSLEGWT